MPTSSLERLYCRAISLIKAHVVNLLRIASAVSIKQLRHGHIDNFLRVFFPP
jgi:hypothetical protein